MLKAICKALKDEIKWPTEDERRENYYTYQNVFVGNVGVFDVTEWITCKWADQQLERETYSGKQQNNTMKTLAVINKHGYFIYYDLLAKGRRNDRDQWTSCDLYLNAGFRCGSLFSALSNDTGIMTWNYWNFLLRPLCDCIIGCCVSVVCLMMLKQATEITFDIITKHILLHIILSVFKA